MVGPLLRSIQSGLRRTTASNSVSGVRYDGSPQSQLVKDRARLRRDLSHVALSSFQLGVFGKGGGSSDSTLSHASGGIESLMLQSKFHADIDGFRIFHILSGSAGILPGPPQW